jgi:hypothetical protein
MRPVGDLVATHRVRLGRFTADRIQLIALPVVGPDGGPDAVTAPVRAMLYEPAPEGGGWPASEVDTEHLRIVHGVVVDRFPGAALDSLVLASAEGITWLGHDGRSWRRSSLGTGVAPRAGREFPAFQFGGSGNLAFGRVDGRPHALIVAVEPFHGNTLAVYLRPPGELSFDQPWSRRTVEVYPPPDLEHDAVAHHVVAADLDGDGDDEFLVALRGPAPIQGVCYYKFNAAGDVLVRELVSDGSAARIAVADFDGDGRLDFVTTAYDTVGYYEVADPRIELHTNTFAPPTAAAAPPPGNG